MTEQEYILFIQPYQDACQNMMMRLETLNKDYRRKYKNYPIHNLQYRIKSLESMNEKLIRNGYEQTVEHAGAYLMDVGGIRVICYFEEDIYNTVSIIKKQTDVVKIKEQDYISRPKPNGYRSYHLVLGIPVYHTDGKEYYPVEIQLRTISMDFWASMEHRICYKKKLEDRKKLSGELLQYAKELEILERKFESHKM